MDLVNASEATGGAGGCVYYNYVLADSALVAYQPDAAEQRAVPLTAAQQQYPMLVQQCVANEPLEAVAEATLNVVLTAIDGQQPQQQPQTAYFERPSGEPVYYDREPDDEVDDDDDEEEDDECDDFEADDGGGADRLRDGYESEQELTSLAWLSDPARNSAVNVLAAVGAVDDDDGDDGDDDDDAPMDVKPLLLLANCEAPPMLAAKQREAARPSGAPAATAIKQRSAKSAAAAAAASDADADGQRQLNDPNVTQERFNKFMQQVQQSQAIYASNEPAYRALATEKPPFNYAQIIAMAMMQCGRMTLKDICQWIRERFAYYRQLDNWNNSIRHNLSLHFCFTKIARNKAEKGKGGYWELSMNRTKGEKKRVRNRSKRALAAAAAAAAAADGGRPPAAKRPRRVAAAMRGRKAPYHCDGAGGGGGGPADRYHATELAASEAAAAAAATAEQAQQQQQQQQLCAVFEGADFGQLQSVLLDNEIFLGCEIPMSGDSIVIPYNGGMPSNCGQSLSLAIPTSTPTSPTSSLSSSLSSTSSSPSAILPHHGDAAADDDLTAATLIAHGLTHTLGPNVIVEAMPYGGSTATATNGGQSVFDQVGDIERQISRLVQMPEPELVEYDVYFDYTW